MKHKSDDYKISAVKYYLKNKDNIRKTCKIFDCSKTSLQRWIDRYKTTKNITRKNRKPISYKINKDQVKTAVNMIDKNEQFTIDELLFAIGDWEQRKQMKYKEPTLGKGIRTLFRKNNYNVFLVDEFRSSCKCSKCDGGMCEKFMVREHPNKKENKDELRLTHGLLRCKSGCGSWNRDRNGSSNIYKIAKNAINNIDRPSYLCRETSNQSTSTTAYNQTLRRYEKT
jgi:transposase